MSELLDRQPPSNVEAEQGVLGSILLLPETLDEIALLLRAPDFYDDANRILYEHMLAIHDGGRHVDLLVLTERLKSQDDWETVGGAAYLYEVGQAVPTPAHAVYYAEIVKDKAMLRSLIRTGTEIVRDSFDQSIPSREMLARAEEKIFTILENKGGREVATISQVLLEALDRINARMDKDHALGGVATGFTDLDSLLGGLHKSELIILAARPSMGKTALALNMAEYAVMHAAVPTLFVSLEMSAVELGDRLLCSAAEVDGKRLRDGTLSQDDRKKLVQAAAEISSTPLFVDDSPSRTMTEIAAAARRMRRREGLGLVVVDYLQLIEPDNPRDPRQEQVAKIARRLKGLAREIDVPVLCLAQLNRQAESGKEGHRPKLSHLRESGAIEQDADVVMFVHRDEYYESDPDEREQLKGRAEIIVAKQRNGPVGDVKLVWDHRYTRFRNSAIAQHGFPEEYVAEPATPF